MKISLNEIKDIIRQELLNESRRGHLNPNPVEVASGMVNNEIAWAHIESEFRKASESEKIPRNMQQMYPDWRKSDFAFVLKAVNKYKKYKKL
jgi:hypothetical protein